MSADPLSMLMAVARSLPEDHDNEGDYLDRVPAGPARELLRALLSGDENAVIKIPLTLRVSAADLPRLLAAWTGNDDDVVLAAEVAIRNRLDREGDAAGDRVPGLYSGEPEVWPDEDQMRALSAMRSGESFPW